MKTVKLLITLYVFLTSFLFVGMALANDSGILDSVNADSNLAAPNLTVQIDGRKVTLSWNEVAGASHYQVHYAQKPYDNPDTIKTINVGNKTSALYELSPGSAYHISVKACKDSGSDCSDYSIIHDVVIPLVSSFKNSLGQEFKLIPAGTFTMGSPADEPGREDPPIIEDQETQHSVTLTKPFYMQTTEVTQAQWEAVMKSNPSEHSGCLKCPVEMVSWDDAQSYITKINQIGKGTYSLPTEAQWEYAARAGSTTAFYNGGITTDPDDVNPNLDVIGWYIDNSRPIIGDPPTYGPKASWPVGQKEANVWGLYDMSGNVTEWCQDWFSPYPTSAVTDPTGPTSGNFRVVRGGCFAVFASDCRSASRWMDFPTIISGDQGFRLAWQP
jgi:formylglycine-generating enzyme required for sulfatase activity